MFSGLHFRLNKYISRNIFYDVLGALRYTNEEVKYTDTFWEMRQMEELWNKNMEEKFNPGCINVLDKSMMEWFNNYSPVFVCVDRKPHIFGNDRDTVCCGLTSIIWRAPIVEGKYFPSQRGSKQHQEFGKTVGLMLGMYKPIFDSGKAVVFDRGFFVAKGVVELGARGAYGGTLIKKRRYWPNNVPDDDIDKHFEGKEVGSVDFLEMKTDEGKSFKIHCSKEPDYVMKLVASWMTLNDL